MKKLDRFQFPAQLREHGLVVPNSPKYVRGHLSFYEPCDVVVSVERRKRKKSREQLGYYFGVVLPEISNHTGHSILELDLLMKEKFLKQRVLWRGTEMLVTGSKKPLTSNELAEFISNVILEAGELGIAVPPPDQAYQFKD